MADRKAFGTALAKVSSQWIAGAGAGAVERRRLTAATVALELARPAMDRPSEELVTPVGGPIIEWAGRDEEGLPVSAWCL